MVKILKGFRNAQQYLRAYPHLLGLVSRICPRCRAHALVGHGCYERFARCFDFDGRLSIRRLLCRECGVTVSLLPAFLRPRRVYSDRVFRYAGRLRRAGCPLFELPSRMLRRGLKIPYFTTRDLSRVA
jgi:hypothetical protein